MTALCLLSGGLDSSVALGMVAVDVRLALTVDYGQQAAAAEVRAAAAVASYFGVAHQSIRLPFPLTGGGALLGDGSSIPEPTREELDAGGARMEETAASVWVPNRNGVLLQWAAAHAEGEGLDRLIVGFNREEAETFADNGAAFLDATNQALAYSTRNGVRAESPTIAMDKREILQEAGRVGLPLDLVWPCYRAGSAPCGRCESCARFLRAASSLGLRPWPASGSC